MKYSLRSLKFSIRDLMWFIFVLALMLGWWVDSWKKSNFEARALEAENEALFLLHHKSDFDPDEWEIGIKRLKRKYLVPYREQKRQFYLKIGFNLKQAEAQAEQDVQNYLQTAPPGGQTHLKSRLLGN